MRAWSPALTYLFKILKTCFHTAGTGDTVVIKDNTLDLTDSSLGEEAGIKKKKRYKSLSVVKEKVRLLQEFKTGRSDLILGIRKVS